MLQELRSDVQSSIQSAFAAGTRKNLKVHWRAFLLFCNFFQLKAIPADLETICLFIQFLSRSLKSVSSIKNYISGVRTLHLLLQFPFPHLEEFSLKLLFRGIARCNPHTVKQAQPITPEILFEIRKHLDLSNCNDATFWCLFLFAFFLMARKSNLVPDSATTFDPKKHLTRDKVIFENDVAIVIFEWSKTIQFGERILKIPLVENPHSILCPIQAYRNMCKLVPASPNSPAFLLKSQNGFRPLTYIQFNTFLKTVLEQTGRDPSLYSSHSFRRGGATYSFQSQVPSELIKLHGDWASDAYMLYLQFSLSDKISVAKRMVDALPF